MKTQSNTPSSSKHRALTGKLIAFSVFGAYFAVLFAGLLLNAGKASILDPEFIIYVNPLTFGIAWLVLTAVLVAYGSISKAMVYGFTWIASAGYALTTAVLGESYYLTFAMCGVVAVTTYLCGKALRAEKDEKKTAVKPEKSSESSLLGGKIAVGTVAVLGGGLTLFLLLSSYFSYTTDPSVSTGVYVQMMESLRSGFSFDTTLEFGESVSHMATHFSPIFLVYLPFYAVFPSPVTLMVLQTLAVYSSVVPMWLICRRKGLSPVLSAVVCGLLCFFPAVLGGAAGSVHEYALLLPLLLWLLWALETKRRILPWVFAVLILCVRETCAIHLLTVGLYHVLSAKAEGDAKTRKGELGKGLILMGLSLVYFIAAMAILTYAGKGTLITRFDNVTGIYGTGFGNLVREIICNPAIAFYEMLLEAKLHYLLCLLLPLGLIPVLAKRKVGLVFLLPLLLLNLLSDFPYHFSLDFPYSFGVAAFGLYLCADGLAALSAKEEKAVLMKRLATLAVCFTVLIGGFRLAGYSLFVEYTFEGRDEAAAMTDLLTAVEDGASVSASGRLLPSLADRKEIYTLKNGQETEFVVIDLREEWVVDSDSKYDEKYYTDKGYSVVKRYDGVGVVLKKGN